MNSNNALRIIEPYRFGGTWVFDDAAVGLQREPFVAGMDAILDRVADGAERVTLLFSEQPFPGYQFRLDHIEPEHEGHWYYEAGLKMEGWLCPAMFHYFEAAPEHIYVRIKDNKESTTRDS